MSDGEEKEYSVEQIIDHRLCEDGTEQFRVRWKGYTSEDDTWEPFENVEENTQFQKYQKQRQRAEKKKQDKWRSPQKPAKASAAGKRKRAAAAAAGGDDEESATEQSSKRRRAESGGVAGAVERLFAPLAVGQASRSTPLPALRFRAVEGGRLISEWLEDGRAAVVAGAAAVGTAGAAAGAGKGKR